MRYQPISRAEEITFSMWSELAASMLGLDADARADQLDARQIDAEAFEEAQKRHLLALARGLSIGDDTLADEHARNVRTQLEAPVPGAEDVTGDETQFPVVRATPVLPFKTAGAPTPPTQVPMPSSDVDPGGETMPFGSVASVAMPFSDQGELRFIRLEAFASLSAELRRAPANREDLLRRAGFADEEAFQRLAQTWAQRFETTPPLRVRFEELVAENLMADKAGAR